jgi:arabinan endo-1,5-alpha-L-arabinosidase
VTGPYLDNIGQDMLRGGGKLVVAANGRFVGPGHFGLTDLGDGVQKFSCHYEADLDRGGRSILDVRALLWKDGWPVAGDNFIGGTFEVESARSGYALELGVEAVPLAGGRVRLMGAGGPGGRGGAPGGTNAPGGRGMGGAPGGTNAPSGRGMGGGMGMGRGASGPMTPIPPQEVDKVSTNWASGNLGIRLGDYMLQAHQKWTISAVTNVSGFLGSPSFKIQIAGTDRTLAASADGEVVAVPAFTGSPEQLWRIDQLIDGTYRIVPKEVPNSKDLLALTAVGNSTPTLAKFDPKSDKARWNLKTP